MLPIVHHPGYSIDWPERHPFPMAKFRALRERLSALGFDSRDDVRWITPHPASSDALLRTHTADYLQRFYLGDIANTRRTPSGFPWSPALVERTLLEVGGTLATVEAARENGLALNSAGGTHHAYADRASGYCLLNDLAVATHYLLAEHRLERILIVDCDVHQGDGTAWIFRHEPRVFTFSIHGEANFPFEKVRGDRDVALPRGTDDDAYLRCLARELDPILSDFRPQFVLFDAGADVHAGDRLGHFSLSTAGLYRRDRFVLARCRDLGIPVAGVIGGGYDRDLQALADRHAQLFLAALALNPECCRSGKG
ncbi:histone deacetylase family protein [Salinicola socius]|uniref:Histone deacetylase n=1 Tax=Salinicola socius TaxID=404433 RepID=A0A1Q8SS83_9GAMM|nr:histone deacetylase [Salinicola socius]OLO04277.1 histone deacetylase [Salinicola socius]